MNLYENQQPDARQSTAPELAAGDELFRSRYRQLSDAEVDLHDRIKRTAGMLAALFYEVEPIHKGLSKNRERGANVQMAIRHLEDAVYRGVKALTGPVAQVNAMDNASVASKEPIEKGERKPGINDLPPDQQKQLDDGAPLTPHADPGSELIEQTNPDPARDVIDVSQAGGQGEGRPAEADDGGRGERVAQTQPGPAAQ
jgi:hypothetical protein